MLEIGSVIDGKYKILNVIGRGGMSVVYLAMNEKANKQWAIKEVRKDGVSNFDVIKQGLIVETDMLKKFDHPALPSIIDVIDQDGTFLIVMDYIQGNPLSDSIQEHGALPQSDVIDWAIQLCDVLDYLHNQTPPIIYRDMKPANVMLKPDGKVTLIDFGTAREYKTANVEDTTCLGTRGYAAPEQFGGQGQTDPRTDIYCLGATLYHLVTGHNPSEPPYEIVPIRQWDESLSQGLENIIIKCTQNNPDDRYQTCTELLYALEHYEELDDVYIRAQKKKLKLFSLTAALTIGSLAVAGWANHQSNKIVASDYDYQMEIAASTEDYSTKLASYISALSIRPDIEEPYDSLIELFSEDLTIDEDEANILNRLSIGDVKQDVLKILEKNSSSAELVNVSKLGKLKPLDQLQSNQQGYGSVCYKIGEALWFYYKQKTDVDGESEIESDTSSDVTKKTIPLAWFKRVCNNEQASEEQKRNAEMYAKIGEFYQTIPQKIYKGTDAGEYKKIWDYFETLLEADAMKNTSDAIKVRLYDEIISNIYSYSSSFQSDGVLREKLESRISSVEKDIAQMQTNNVYLLEDIKKINNNIPEARKKLDIKVVEEETEQGLEATNAGGEA